MCCHDIVYVGHFGLTLYRRWHFAQTLYTWWCFLPMVRKWAFSALGFLLSYKGNSVLPLLFSGDVLPQQCTQVVWSCHEMWVNNAFNTSCYFVISFPCGAPEGEARDVWCLPLFGISGLSFDSTWLFHLLFFLSSSVTLSVLSFILPAGPFFWTFSGKFFNIFH